ncbi:hypothetical protein TERTU_1479 [Teredinibacter turnerae T7901]|uniref:Uncharacterized protein n=1 Tax=Teredinibacter turnerae (strain ATCC 39867 / T7901) TaxID=377629 RepID=C5BT58_TERTT|nr:hypothetical protein TERTU_1479 [Teredinibacter turnerae T7901]
MSQRHIVSSISSYTGNKATDSVTMVLTQNYRQTIRPTSMLRTKKQ